MVWILSPYDSPPGEGWRPLRSENLARALVRRGYRVTLWMSCFSYHTKSFRAEPWSVRQMDPDWKIVFVPTVAYQKNIDLNRLKSEATFAKNIYARSGQEPKPNVIVTREPPQVLGHHALKIARETGAKVISDVYDLWPEFFHQVLPPRISGLGRILFTPWYRWRKRNWDRSDGVCALAQEYLQITLRTSPTLFGRPHRVVYNGVDVEQFRSLMKGPGQEFLPKTEGELWAIYAGTLGNSYDVGTMVEVAKLLATQEERCRIIVAGSGPLLPIVQEAHDDPAIPLTYVGKLAPTDLLPLYGRCDIGLCTYSGNSNVEMPDKFYDYTAAGLPIVGSLTGEMARVMNERELGLSYEAGSASDLALKLQTLTNDPDLLRRMAANSWNVAADYDALPQFDVFVDLIDEVLRP
jgi:glycosyltransferase involved in cell wall biosynthesis